MRADKFKTKNIKSNIGNILEVKQSFKNIFEDYKSDYWIVGRLQNLNVRTDTIFSEDFFYKNKEFVIKIHNFVLEEKKYITDKSTHVLCYDLRYFFRYIISIKGYIDLSEIDYCFLDQYANYIKKTGQSKIKYEKAKKVLNKMKKYDYFYLHKDVLDNNYPVHNNFKKPKKQEDFYNEDNFKNIATCLNNIIEDYFEGKIQKSIFIKSAYWFLSFCTGFNKTAMDNLNKEYIEKTINKKDENVFYLITGLKNRGKKGFQQSRISVSKNHIFEKVINELFILHEEIRKNHKINDSYLFYYEKINKNTFLKKYHGHMFQGDGIEYYFKKHNIENIKFSTQKMRNQWSLKMLSISDDVNKVSQLLDHSNTDITLSYYLKSRLSNTVILKFKAFQELLYQYSNNENFDKWTEFQKILQIDNTNINDIIKKIKEGYYEKATGNCVSNENKSCSNYFNCFNCKNYSIIGDKDLWKLISMRESIIEEGNIKFNWLIETINEILKDFSKDDLLIARKIRNEKGRHPYWKNKIMIKTLMNNYEELK